MQNRGIGRICHKVRFLHLGEKKLQTISVLLFGGCKASRGIIFRECQNGLVFGLPKSTVKFLCFPVCEEKGCASLSPERGRKICWGSKPSLAKPNSCRWITAVTRIGGCGLKGQRAPGLKKRRQLPVLLSGTLRKASGENVDYFVALFAKLIAEFWTMKKRGNCARRGNHSAWINPLFTKTQKTPHGHRKYLFHF